MPIAHLCTSAGRLTIGHSHLSVTMGDGKGSPRAAVAFTTSGARLRSRSTWVTRARETPNLLSLHSLEDVYITINQYVFDTPNYRYYSDSIKYYSGEILVAVVDQVSGKNSLAELKWQQPFPGRIDERLMNELTKYSEVLFNE